MVYFHQVLATLFDMRESQAISGQSATPTLLTWKDNNYHILYLAYLEAMNTTLTSQCELVTQSVGTTISMATTLILYPSERMLLVSNHFIYDIIITPSIVPFDYG